MSEEFDVVILGGGPGGYVAAIRCAQKGLKTACIDASTHLGGTCLNVGCVPSKTLLHSSEHYAFLKNEGSKHGIESKGIHLNWTQMLKHKNDVLTGLGQGISGLFRKNKVHHFKGHGVFVDSHTIEVDGKEKVKGKTIILALGSTPIELPFLPFDEKKVLSSTGALTLDPLPKSMVVIGAGVIGVEMASVYSRLGTKVTVVEFLDKVCAMVDDLALSQQLQKSLERQGIAFLLNTKVEGAQIEEKHVSLNLGKDKLEADVVLVAIGRAPNTRNLGLEKLGIELDKRGFVHVNTMFQTTLPHIYAVGDIIDGAMLAHKASEEGYVVAELLSGNTHVAVNYMTIPNIIYTTPEIASVGCTEHQAQLMGIPHLVGNFSFKGNSRARCYGEDEGFVKLIADKQGRRLIGMHVIGPMASEIIAYGMQCIKERTTIESIAHSPFPHPTFSEAIKEAALSIHDKPIHN